MSFSSKEGEKKGDLIGWDDPYCCWIPLLFLFGMIWFVFLLPLFILAYAYHSLEPAQSDQFYPTWQLVGSFLEPFAFIYMVIDALLVIYILYLLLRPDDSDSDPDSGLEPSRQQSQPIQAKEPSRQQPRPKRAKKPSKPSVQPKQVAIYQLDVDSQEVVTDWLRERYNEGSSTLLEHWGSLKQKRGANFKLDNSQIYQIILQMEEAKILQQQPDGSYVVSPNWEVMWRDRQVTKKEN
jgi:hypothetical protein